jgi:FkbM family methyltransferase
MWEGFHIRNHKMRAERSVIRECCDYPVWHYKKGSWPFTKWEFKNKFDPRVVLDVGGCIGGFSVLAKRYFPDCKTFTLEPFSENRYMCELNLNEQDPSGNWEVLNGALNYFPEKTRFIDAKVHSGGGCLTTEEGFQRIKDGGDSRYVAIDDFSTTNYTLRDLVELAGGKVDILKMDCEGGENGLIVNSEGKHEASPDIELLKDIPIVVGEWHGHELGQYKQGHCNSLFVNFLLDNIADTHHVISYDPRTGDNLGNFFCWKKDM